MLAVGEGELVLLKSVAPEMWIMWLFKDTFPRLFGKLHEFFWGKHTHTTRDKVEEIGKGLYILKKLGKGANIIKIHCMKLSSN